MCVSAEVDIAAGVIVGIVAADALRHVQDPSRLPLALLPVALALHQLVEVVVWWGLDGTVSADTGLAAARAYLVIAFALPMALPYMVALMEPDPGRRRVIGRLWAAGVATGVLLVAGVVSGPVATTDMGDHVFYEAALVGGVPLTAAYVTVTLGCLLLSSHRFLVAFGLANLAAVVVLAVATRSGFVSLWCAWAALTSLGIAVHLRRDSPPLVRAQSPAPGPA